MSGWELEQHGSVLESSLEEEGGGVSGESDKSALRAPVGCHLGADREHVMIPPPRHLIWGQCDSVFSPACRWVTSYCCRRSRFCPTTFVLWATASPPHQAWRGLDQTIWWAGADGDMHRSHTDPWWWPVTPWVRFIAQKPTFYFFTLSSNFFLVILKTSWRNPVKLSWCFSPSSLWYQQEPLTTYIKRQH